MFRQKVFRPEIKVLDAKAGRIEAVVSTEAVDRDGDVIRQAGWQLDDFYQHPILLSSHDYRSLRSQIGEWEDMGVNGKTLRGVARYYIGEGNPEADWAFNLAAKNRAAFSVGFIPLEYTERETKDSLFGSYEFTKQTLLEVSHVTVPANPEALQLLVRSVGKGLLDPEIEDILREIAGTDTKMTDVCMMPACGMEASIAAPLCKDHLAELMGGPSGPMTEGLDEPDETLAFDGKAFYEAFDQGVTEAMEEVLHA